MERWNILLMLFMLVTTNAGCVLDFWRENRLGRAASFVLRCFYMHIEGKYGEQVLRICYRNIVAVP